MKLVATKTSCDKNKRFHLTEVPQCLGIYSEPEACLIPDKSATLIDDGPLLQLGRYALETVC